MPKVRITEDCRDITDFVATKGSRVDGTAEQLWPLVLAGRAQWIGPPPEKPASVQAQEADDEPDND